MEKVFLQLNRIVHIRGINIRETLKSADEEDIEIHLL